MGRCRSSRREPGEGSRPRLTRRSPEHRRSRRHESVGVLPPSTYPRGVSAHTRAGQPLQGEWCGPNQTIDGWFEWGGDVGASERLTWGNLSAAAAASVVALPLGCPCGFAAIHARKSQPVRCWHSMIGCRLKHERLRRVIGPEGNERRRGSGPLTNSSPNAGSGDPEDKHTRSPRASCTFAPSS